MIENPHLSTDWTPELRNVYWWSIDIYSILVKKLVFGIS